ncbi:testis development-related protein isoform X2 [Canis lupus familiaris]|uniref:testis development-related protein isoform X2 n=1 Tax=Canis lupus familiaris TaxID=9615 RepID=UPI0006B3EA73|nr:testis development-related protein isoform X2 [Canis lupus familiaris]
MRGGKRALGPAAMLPRVAPGTSWSPGASRSLLGAAGTGSAAEMWEDRSAGSGARRRAGQSLSEPGVLRGVVQGASFRGWKEVTSLFNKDDEQHLLERCKSPKSKGTNLRLREELKTEKKPGFWDNLVLKQNIQSKKPDEIEGWEPPKLALEDVTADPPGDAASGRPPRPGWEEDSKSCSKYSSLASSGNSSRWSLRSAGKLVGIRRHSRGHLTDNWEELE